MTINKHVLLTGAGFTNNIGTPLAHEMWSYIYNNKSIQRHPEIVESLFKIFPKQNEVRYFDFEAAYYEIIFGGLKGIEYSKEIQSSMKDATKSAYNWIDEIVKDCDFGSKHEIQMKWYKLIGNFREGHEESYIFTLNQDLFVERCIPIGFYIPGFPREIDVNDIFNIHKKALSDHYYYPVPNEKSIIQIENSANKFHKNFYIKLHGSCNWYRENKDYAMIIGYNKRKQSDAEPLIQYYNSIFKNILCQGDIELLIIGYGFGDDNINDIIIKAVTNYGLKLHIVNPMKIGDFYDFINISNHEEQVELRLSIKKGLSGYYPYKLLEIINNNTLFNRLIENYFG